MSQTVTILVGSDDYTKMMMMMIMKLSTGGYQNIVLWPSKSILIKREKYFNLIRFFRFKYSQFLSIVALPVHTEDMSQ